MDFVFYFTIYSFLGWTLETIYASIAEKKFVNRGFLQGFFCPIYGFGAILIILASNLARSLFTSNISSILIGLCLSILLVTVLEYITGLILEKVFKCKWWDYSNDFGNLQGYVCIKNSLLWGGLAFLLVQFVHPVTAELISRIPDLIKNYGAMFIIIYFIADTAKAVIDMIGLRKVILYFSNFPDEKYYEKIIQYRRFFRAFPRLMLLNAEVINRDIRSILNGGLDRIKTEIKSRL